MKLLTHKDVPNNLEETLEMLLEDGWAEISADMFVPVIEYWKNLLAHQRMLVDIPDKKILMVGDIHGDLLQLKRAFHLFDSEGYDYIIFDGDVIDRGPEMLECLEIVMSRQIRDPDHIFYLRGNHELQSINEMYGFRGYCTGIFGSSVYHAFSEAFQQLPLASKIGDWGFICHGGIPNERIFFHLMRLEPKEFEPEGTTYAQLMWNDPDEDVKTFASSIRAPHYYRFGKQPFETFMDFHELEYFFRAHQAFSEGFKWFFEDQLLSIFSSQAGPYSHVQPHFVSINKKKIELIKANNIEIDLY